MNRKIWKAGPLVRVELFSDAVFAISITLLVLDIKVPEVKSFDLVPGGLRFFWPQIFAYLLTFTIIAMEWVDHHTIFHHIERLHQIEPCKKGLFWTNFIFLMCIAFLPFPTTLLGRFPDEQGPVEFYSGVVFLTILAKVVLRRYVNWAQLAEPAASNKFNRRTDFLWLSGLCVAFVLFILAHFWPRFTTSAWFGFGVFALAARLWLPLELKAPGKHPDSRQGD